MDRIWSSCTLLIFAALFVSVVANGDQPQWIYSENSVNWDPVSNANDRYSGWDTYSSQELGGDHNKRAELQIKILQNGYFSFAYYKDGGRDTYLYLWKNRDRQQEIEDNEWTKFNRTIYVQGGDVLKWRLEVNSPSAKAQAMIAVPPAGSNGTVPPPEEIRTPSIPERPSGPDRGYTNQPCSFSTNFVDSNEDIDYQFEFDGHPSNPTKDTKAENNWTTPGQKKVRVKAINKQGNASDWSQPKIVVIFEQIPVTENLQSKINSKISYAEFILQNDQEDVNELEISEKNNISIRSENGNKFKLDGHTAPSRVKIVNSENISIQQSTIFNSGGIGIKLDNCHYCTISQNDIKFGQGTAGIYISGNNNSITGNTLENITGSCSAFSDGILIEQGKFNIILNNIIKKNNKCKINHYSVNTTGPFMIAVPDQHDFPIQLFIGYRDPICTCQWHETGTMKCADNGNSDSLYQPEDNDIEALVWSTFPGRNQ
jgi:hypothetical protein